MNLHAIVGPVISAINPTTPAAVLASLGATTNVDGSQTPSYDYPLTVQAQVQSLTFRDLQQIEGLNLQGTRRGIYLYGRVDGVVRPLAKGGDLIQITVGVNAGTWLVAQVLEQWPDWCKVAATLQNGS